MDSGHQTLSNYEQTIYISTCSASPHNFQAQFLTNIIGFKSYDNSSEYIRQKDVYSWYRPIVCENRYVGMYCHILRNAYIIEGQKILRLTSPSKK